MLETGAVSRQDGVGRGSDGEGLAAAPDEEPESQHQLDPAVFPSHHHSSVSPPLACIHRGRRSRLGCVTEGKREILQIKHLPPHVHLSSEPPRDFIIPNNSMKQCRDCLKSLFFFERLSSVLCSPRVEI